MASSIFLVLLSQTLYLTATLGKGLVALVHSTSSIPSRSKGEVAVPVVVVSNLGLPQPLKQLFFHCPKTYTLCTIIEELGSGTCIR